MTQLVGEPPRDRVLQCGDDCCAKLAIYACRAVVFAKAGRSTRLAPFMLSVFYEFPPKSDSQFLRQCDGKIFQTRNS